MNTTMKKSICLLLLSSLIMTLLTGCEKETPSNTPTPTASQENQLETDTQKEPPLSEVISAYEFAQNNTSWSPFFYYGYWYEDKDVKKVKVYKKYKDFDNGQKGIRYLFANFDHKAFESYDTLDYYLSGQNDGFQSYIDTNYVSDNKDKQAKFLKDYECIGTLSGYETITYDQGFPDFEVTDKHNTLAKLATECLAKYMKENFASSTYELYIYPFFTTDTEINACIYNPSTGKAAPVYFYCSFAKDGQINIQIDKKYSVRISKKGKEIWDLPTTWDSMDYAKMNYMYWYTIQTNDTNFSISDNSDSTPHHMAWIKDEKNIFELSLYTPEPRKKATESQKEQLRIFAKNIQKWLDIDYIYTLGITCSRFTAVVDANDDGHLQLITSSGVGRGPGQTTSADVYYADTSTETIKKYYINDKALDIPDTPDIPIYKITCYVNPDTNERKYVTKNSLSNQVVSAYNIKNMITFGNNEIVLAPLSTKEWRYRKDKYIYYNTSNNKKTKVSKSEYGKIEEQYFSGWEKYDTKISWFVLSKQLSEEELYQILLKSYESSGLEK